MSSRISPSTPRSPTVAKRTTMNARVASLLTALLFLAAPIALVSPAQAQYPIECFPGGTPDPDCIENPPAQSCPNGTTGTFPACTPTTGPPAAEVDCETVGGADPIWTALCTVAVTNLGATLVDGVDADNDDRADLAVTSDGAYIQLDYFFTDKDAGTKDEIYAGINPTQAYKVRVDPLLYNPTDGSRMDDDESIGDIPYYLTNQHTYTAPDQPGIDANSAPDQLFYQLALVVEIPANDDSGGTVDGGVYSIIADHTEGITMGTTQCVACIDAPHARTAFGAHYYRTDVEGAWDFVIGGYYYDGADENVIDVDVPNAATDGMVEDSILERSIITTVSYTKLNDMYGVDTVPTTYPDTTNPGFSTVHIKDVGDKDWKVNFQFRSDLDDDSWVDYLEVDCGTNPLGASNCDDFDGDTLSNVQEAMDAYPDDEYPDNPELQGDQLTDPYDVDSDNDGVWDADDVDPLGLLDHDFDGLNDALDNCDLVRNTANGNNIGSGNPLSIDYQRDHWGIVGGVPTAGADGIGDHCQDSDGDGIKDYIEDDVSPYGTVNAAVIFTATPAGCGESSEFAQSGDSSPLLVDTDGDNLTDAQEDVDKNGGRRCDSSGGDASTNDFAMEETDPNNPDSDGDGVWDRNETLAAYVWNGYGAHPGALNNLDSDEDNDGLKTRKELAGETNSYCKVASGPSIRVDASTSDSCTVGNPTNPKSPDTDGDRTSDAQEQAKVGPALPSGQTDALAGAFDTFDTDPTRADTDNDTYSDRYEERPYVQAVPRINLPAPVGAFDVPEATTTKSNPTDPASKPVSSVPVLDPNEPHPDPIALLTNPDCYLQENMTFTDACFTREGILGEFDSRDSGDSDGDGQTDDSNNQVDLIEERILRINQDDGDASPEDLEGSGTAGATFTTYELRIGGKPVEEYTTRFGDVGRSAGITEYVVFIEHRGGDRKYVSCIYSKDGDLRQAGFDLVGYVMATEGHEIGFLNGDADPHFGNEVEFDPTAAEPCGPSQSLGEAPLDPGAVPGMLCDSGVEDFCPPEEPVDSDGDGVEDSKDRCPGVDDADEELCPPEPEEPVDPCDPSANEDFPVGCDPLAMFCAEDPFGLPVCAEECDPETEECGPAEGCDPASPSEACADPEVLTAMLCDAGVPVPGACEGGDVPVPECGPDYEPAAGYLTLCMYPEGGPLTKNAGLPGMRIGIGDFGVNV